MSNCLITGIGSLPHHNVDAALQHAFEYDVPFLPQIPIRNPKEFMIAAALEDLPGSTMVEGGIVEVDLAEWTKKKTALDEKLAKALSSGDYREFEPSAEAVSCWKPFLWELQERKLPEAKVQIAGPLTCQWSLVLSDGTKIEQHSELAAQVLKLVTVKASALASGLKRIGVQPILFLDEPGLYVLNRLNPKQTIAFQELKFLVSALKKQGARVGLHCCSNTDWQMILESGIQVLSCDTDLSLSKLLDHKKEFSNFISSGQRLSLGIVPTNQSAKNLSTPARVEKLFSLFHEKGIDAEVIRQVMRYSYLTPACGLAFKTVGDAESILSELVDAQALISEKMS